MPIRSLLDSLLVYDPHRSTATANLWIAHPSPSEEATFGKLFMVISIDSTDRLNHEIISALQDHIRHAYYQSPESKFSLAFEHALRETNQYLHRLVIEGVDGWVDRLHCVIGVIANDQLLLSSAGSMMAYVVRRGRMHDILGGSTGPVNPLKIFSNLVEGSLEPNDQFIVCTPTVLDYFSLEKLRRTIAEHPPTESVRLLEAALLGHEQRIALAALIVQTVGQVEADLPTIVPREIGRPSTVAPQRSMDSLIARERATEQLLTPSIWPSIRDTLSQAHRAVGRMVRTHIFRRPVKRMLPATMSHQPTTPTSLARARPSLAGIGRGLGRGWRLVVASWRTVWISWRRQRARRDIDSPSPAPALPRQPGTWLNRLVAWFGSLAPQQRKILGLGLLALFVLTATVVVTNNHPAGITDSPEALTQQIEEHVTKAEAALLYGGEATAREQLAEAMLQIEQLPNKSKSDKTRRDLLAARLASVRTQLRRVVTIADPEIIAQLAEVAPTLRPLQVYWTGERVWSYDPSQQSGILVDLATIDAPTVISNTIDTGQPTTGAVVANGVLLFATARQGFAELNLATATWRPLDVTWPSGEHVVQSLSFFQNRIYALDRVGQEIFRFARGSASLGTGVKWLKETAALSGARAVAVDGSIFILQAGGVVEEYFNGRRGDFQLASVDPAVTNATRLITGAESTKLYVLDPSNSRLVVFDKNGKLVRQYQSSSWTSLADMAINEANKTAIVLSGTTLYRLTLQD